MDEDHWTNQAATTADAPSLDDLVDIMERFDSLSEALVDRLAVADSGLWNEIASAILKAAPADGLPMVSLLGLPVVIDEKLPPHTLLAKNNKGKPLWLMIRTAEGDFLKVELNR